MNAYHPDMALSDADTVALYEFFDNLTVLDWQETSLRCPFCETGIAWKHTITNAGYCLDCNTYWIDDSDFQRATESEDVREVRLALEYQAKYSTPLFATSDKKKDCEP